MSAEALVGVALCGLSGWTLGHLAGAAVVTVRRGVRWASLARLGGNRAASSNGAPAAASTAACPWEARCDCPQTAKTPPTADLGAFSDRNVPYIESSDLSLGQQR